MAPAEPFVVRRDEGRILQGPVGGPARILARAETTDGTLTAIENEVAPMQGPPEHVHEREDEMYLVLEGTIRSKADGRYFEVPAGSFMFIPRGTPHCFQNVADAPARIMVMFAPAGMERFFEGHAQLPAGPPDPEAYRRVAEAAGMRVVGPPMASGEGAAT
jgi:quercetin dioxygenase-like cupin family protein